TSPAFENYLHVDTLEKLKTMLSDIEKAQDLATDLQNYSYRSYEGFTCLLQISTRTTDYIANCL
ncbi:unnamed protein product, partial [Didymodactylos carnosus]